VKEIACPVCRHLLHEVYFADDVRRWRCMNCERIFSEIEYHVGDGELVRLPRKKKVEAANKQIRGDKFEAL